MNNLRKLENALRNNSAHEILNEIIKIKCEYFEEEEINELFFNLLPNNHASYNNYYILTGSGSSHIIKPNITSIASLYLSALGIPILKIGSKKRTSVLGSTDFLEFVGKKNLDKLEYFSYIDSDSKLPQVFYKNLLSINDTFRDYYDKNINHLFTAKGKMVGVSGRRHSKSYCEKHHINSPSKLIVFYAESENSIIDEVVPGKLYINNKKYLEIPEKYDDMNINSSEVLKIDYQLLCGTCENEYWLNSLRYSIGVFLLEFGFEKNMLKAINRFDELYYSKLLKAKLGL